MVKEYKKGSAVKLSKNFSLSEMDCHCKSPSCKITYVDTDLIEFLEEKRDMIGKPLIILSGFRCTAHNKRVGGKPGSQHLQGKAADLKLKNHDILGYVDFFKDAQGLGVYKTFIHVDARSGGRARWFG
jgi:uncharacterized protein YcbK (DUF882 family)